MQALVTGAAAEAYRSRLLSSHDARWEVDVLTLSEQPVGSAMLLDGDIQLQDRTNPVRRTATVTLSDPDGATSIAAGATWSTTGIFMNRLLRFRHIINVPGVGNVTATPFIGVPTQMSRTGAEVQVSLDDKARLAMYGVPSRTWQAKSNAVQAIQQMMAATGENRFRLPASSYRLAKAYSVGLSEDAAPMVVARAIALEMGQELFYSCDGYLLMRPQPTAPIFDCGPMVAQAQLTADFSTVVNTVYLNGKKVVKKSGSATVTTQATAVAETLSTNPVSKEQNARNGVLRRFPLVLNSNTIVTTAQAAAKAKAELLKVDGPSEDANVSIVPVYHLDNDDLVTVSSSDSSTRVVRLTTGTLPLGPGDESGASVGYSKAVTSALVGRPSTRIRRTVKRRKRRRR